jgi:hypothetical protein
MGESSSGGTLTATYKAWVIGSIRDGVSEIKVSPSEFTFPPPEPVTFPQTFTIGVNEGGTVKITGVVSSDPEHFVVTDAPIGLEVPPNKTFKVSFSPPRAGRPSGAIVVTGETCTGISVEPFVVILNSPVFDPIAVPTISQWGVMVMSLLLLIAGTIFIFRRQPLILEPGMISRNAQHDGGMNLPLFVPKVFGKALAGMLTFAGLGIGAAIRLFGSLSATDIGGTLICALLLAHLAHIFMLSAKDSWTRST